LLSKEEFFQSIDLAVQQAKDGKGVKLTPELRKKLFGNL